VPADYFNDITAFVEPGFSRRTCEGVLEELVRRSSSYALAVMDRGLAVAATAMGVTAQGGVDPSDVVLTRMAQDERDVQVRVSHALCLSVTATKAGNWIDLLLLLNKSAGNTCNDELPKGCSRVGHA
jgi:hypothetical protein